MITAVLAAAETLVHLHHPIAQEGTMAKQPKIDPCEYVRDTYGVPARVGMHVTLDKKPGVIKGGSNYVSVLLAGDKKPVNVHPTARLSQR